MRGLACWGETITQGWLIPTGNKQLTCHHKHIASATDQSWIHTTHHLLCVTLTHQASISALNQPAARYQTTKDHPYSPQPTDILLANSKLYPLPCLVSLEENTVNALLSHFPCFYLLSESTLLHAGLHGMAYPFLLALASPCCHTIISINYNPPEYFF